MIVSLTTVSSLRIAHLSCLVVKLVSTAVVVPDDVHDTVGASSGAAAGDDIGNNRQRMLASNGVNFQIYRSLANVQELVLIAVISTRSRVAEPLSGEMWIEAE